MKSTITHTNLLIITNPTRFTFSLLFSDKKQFWTSLLFSPNLEPNCCHDSICLYLFFPSIIPSITLISGVHTFHGFQFPDFVRSSFILSFFEDWAIIVVSQSLENLIPNHLVNCLITSWGFSSYIFDPSLLFPCYSSQIYSQSVSMTRFACSTFTSLKNLYSTWGLLSFF